MVDLDSWKNNRQWMFCNFCLGAYSFGMSLTVYYPTEYNYFKDVMQVENPDFFYGLSWAFLCSSGVLASLIGSYYTDSTGNVRQVCLLSNLLSIIGNVLYVLYYSPYIVLFGQFLVGTAAARMVAGVGEISKVYEASILTQKVALLGIFSTLGSVTGPCTTYLFDLVDTHIGNWKLNISNMAGVTMATLYTIQLCLNFLTLKNVSRQYNLKESECTQSFINNIEKEGVAEDWRSKPTSSEDQERLLKETFYENYKIALLNSLSNKHILVLYVLSFFASYTRAILTLLQPIKTVEMLSWTQTDLAKFNIICTCVGAIPTAILFTLISKKVDDFFLLLSSLVTLLIAVVLLILFPFIVNNQVNANMIIYGNGVLTLVSTASFHIISRSMLAKCVPPRIQTITEALRNALFELAYMIAGLTIKFPSTHLTPSISILAFFLSLAIACLLVHHKTYRNIKKRSN